MDGIQGSYYNSRTGMSNRDFRPRRPHTKSKNGCNQCKNRRIKCDELKPRCTRCSKGDLLCRYPDGSSGRQAGPSERPRSLHLAARTDSSDSSRPTTPGFPGPATAPSPGPYPGSYYLVHPFNQLTLSTCNHHSRAPCPIGSPPPGLASEHEELFDHFTKHSSQAINFDDEDSYALQVGIPTLVKDCPALVATILSVAATCSCVDIISHAAPIPGDRERVMNLLAQANRHHLMSVQTMQRVIAAGGPSPHEHYDHVLANAWMMAAYGTASHRLRIWLYRTRSAGEILEPEFVPNQSGWISMFHNVHAVYMSILGDGELSNGAELEPPLEDFASGSHALLANGGVAFSEEIIPPTKYPMHISHHVLYPMLVSSSPDALQTLRQHAQHVALVVNTVGHGVQDANQESLGSSLSAIEILSEMITRIRSTSARPLSNIDSAFTQNPSPVGFQFDFTPREQGRFAELSPWLTKYLTRALAVTPSRPLRRLIIAFLYRVPRVYLETIKRQLDSFPLDFDTGSGFPPIARHPRSQSGEGPSPIEDYLVDPALLQEDVTLSDFHQGDETAMPMQPRTEMGKGVEVDTDPKSQTTEEILDTLAMDVFSHWLTFTLLLDGVWFLGDIGSWELGRIVAMMGKSGGLMMRHYTSMADIVEEGADDPTRPEGPEEWWPARVYEFAEAIKRGETPRVWW